MVERDLQNLFEGMKIKLFIKGEGHKVLMKKYKDLILAHKGELKCGNDIIDCQWLLK